MITEKTRVRSQFSLTISKNRDLTPFTFWVFLFSVGGQGAGIKGSGNFAWAVHSGNVSAMPVPAAVWLFGSGLIGLLGLARRKC